MMNDNTGILVVDDEFSVRDSLCSWFRKEGYRVGAAENASDALQRLQEEVWDLVLLDIKMPGMDGLELQKRIRQVNPDIVVIIITAYGSVHTAVQALKDGAFDYVTKPIDPDQLNHLVRNAVEQRNLKTENIRLREKIEGLAFGPDLQDGRHLLIVTNDNDFMPAQPNRFLAFAIDSVDLPTFTPQDISLRNQCFDDEAVDR